LAQSRITLPVLGGISGWNRITWNWGAAFIGAVYLRRPPPTAHALRGQGGTAYGRSRIWAVSVARACRSARRTHLQGRQVDDHLVGDAGGGGGQGGGVALGFQLGGQGDALFQARAHFHRGQGGDRHRGGDRGGDVAAALGQLVGLGRTSTVARVGMPLACSRRWASWSAAGRPARWTGS
jgi:hypothetical protein